MKVCSKTTVSLMVAASVWLGLGLTWAHGAAQDHYPAGAMSSAQGHDMHSRMASDGMPMGMHTMPATVTAVDPKTGIVEVTAANMPLRVHFPPSAVASLKPGDRITLHLGFSK